MLTTIDPPNGTNTSLTGINDHGQIVGGYDGPHGPQDFLLSESTFTEIIDPDSPDILIPFGINNRGDIVGELGGFGILFSKGRFTVIEVPDSIETFPRGINDRGEVIVQGVVR